jgi:hypothetical protein
MAGKPTLSLNQLPADMVLLILYHYLPNKQAAIAAVVLYAVITVMVTAVTVKTRSWYMLTAAFTGLLELTGEQQQQQQQQVQVQQQVQQQQQQAAASGGPVPAGMTAQSRTQIHKHDQARVLCPRMLVCRHHQSETAAASLLLLLQVGVHAGP